MIGRDQRITKDFILNNVSQEEIFEKYLNIKLQFNIFPNPLRKDESPTCTFKYMGKISENRNLLWFRDWADSKGYDCFGLVQKIYNNCSFYEALELIAHHFHLLELNLDKDFQYVLSPDKQIQVYRENIIPEIRIKSRPFSSLDVRYWKQYGLEIEDLEDDIVAIKCYWFNGAKHNVGITELGYAYDFRDYNYKLYFPDKDRKKGEIKHLHNNADIFQGENKLNFNKDLLIITSSYKDVKVLRKIDKIYDLNYEVVASMSETIISEKRLDFFLTKYKNILLYHNNDEAGLRAMKAQSEQYNLQYIFNPLDLSKDISDVVKYNGFDKAVETIHNLLYE